MSKPIKTDRQAYLPGVPDIIRAELMRTIPGRRYRDDEGVWRTHVDAPKTVKPPVLPIDI